MKHFLITVDTEGDNLWAWHKGESIDTRNVDFLPRFQTLCNEFGFKPIYLSNYEMLCNDQFCSMVRSWSEKNICEVALHLHAWNNPPLYELNDVYTGNPYLIEYPDEIMYAKFKTLYDLFVDKIGQAPFSHRAGRWAMNETYFNILNQFNVKVDCSHTPGIDWSGNNGATIGGSNYSNVPIKPTMIQGVLEIPLTIRKVHHALKGTLKHRVKTLLLGENLQLRPATNNISQMKRLVDIVDAESNTDYLEFMLHSSELMPAGSPYFEDKRAIEQEYVVLKEIFTYIQHKGYVGSTFIDYYKTKQ